MKTELTQARLKAILRYDPDTGDFTRIKTVSSNALEGYIAGFVRDGRVVISIDGREYKAHRLAWMYKYGEFPTGVIDHINGDPKDNRWLNLRSGTQAQNTQNQRIAAKHNAKSLLIGAHWDERLKRWKSQIMKNKKNIYLGLFNTEVEAHEAYIKAKRELHEFCTI